jgi:hypothetical protein
MYIRHKRLQAFIPYAPEIFIFGTRGCGFSLAVTGVLCENTLARNENQG